MHPRHVERTVQLRPVVPAPALDFGERPDNRPVPAVEVVRHGGLLRLKAEAGCTLPRRRDSVVRYEPALGHAPPP